MYNVYTAIEMSLSVNQLERQESDEGTDDEEDEDPVDENSSASNTLSSNSPPTPAVRFVYKDSVVFCFI